AAPRTEYAVTAGGREGVGPELLATVGTWCAANGVSPEGLRVQRRSLEDVFLELTGRDLR
ncbi:ABC transporter ATP-binding protein, partial [Streptomonospora algeriensis]